jgi:hypothetical protein
MGGIKVGAPGRMVKAGLEQSMATREPYLEPRRETMCLLAFGISISGSTRKQRGEVNIPDVYGNALAQVTISISQNPLD